MKTCDKESTPETIGFQALVKRGSITEGQLQEAWRESARRDMELETILRYEFNIPRRALLESLAEYYGCSWLEYDERRPVPPELLIGLNADQLCLSRWFPAIKDGDTVVIAAADPCDPVVHAEAAKIFSDSPCEFRVALAQDILGFIQDFLNGPPQHIIGNERTGLAYWRNTMSRWRTRLACYRTDFALLRTRFSLLRGGLGLITIGRTLLHLPSRYSLALFYWIMIAAGFGLVLLGLAGYARIKRSVVSPPHYQTIVEVTSASLYFLENYQFSERKPAESTTPQTMLARLANMLPNCCVFIDSSLDNKVRSYLAHERNSLAAQRTVAACYRTVYSRARTGLSFIRTGVSFTSIGLGLVGYFGVGWMTLLDTFLISAGLLLAVDGFIWYWPVRKEQCEASKCAIIA